MDDERLIHSFRKNGIEEIQIRTGSFNGKELIDIRSFMEGPEGMKPTRKGVALLVDLFPELEKGIKKLADALTKKGD